MSYLIFIICLILFISLATISLCLTYKVEDLENELEEKQSLINASRRSLAEAEDKISNRNYLIEYQRNRIESLKAINKELARPGNQN